MIAFLRGNIAGKSLSSAYLDVAGVGYEVQMTSSDLGRLPEVGDKATVLTYLQVSENGISLYGFLSDDARELFLKLIGVSGVGPKVAIAALSTFSPSALADAIAREDVALIQKIPGIGKKTASRIILELKGSIEAPDGLFSDRTVESVLDERMAGATEALLSMGFTSSEAELALKGAPEGATESALLQYALKRLGS